MPKKLLNQIILITGATSGIGRSCAIKCAEQGANIIITGRRKSRLEEVAKEINKHSKCYILEMDVRNYQSVEKLINTLPSEWQNIDVLINNAGLALGTDKINEGNPQEWDTVIDTNIKGVLYLTRLITPGMIQRNKGHIVNLGSVAGHETYPGGGR